MQQEVPHTCIGKLFGASLFNQGLEITAGGAFDLSQTGKRSNVATQEHSDPEAEEYQLPHGHSVICLRWKSFRHSFGPSKSSASSTIYQEETERYAFRLGEHSLGLMRFRLGLTGMGKNGIVGNVLFHGMNQIGRRDGIA